MREYIFGMRIFMYVVLRKDGMGGIKLMEWHNIDKFVWDGHKNGIFSLPLKIKPKDAGKFHYPGNVSQIVAQVIVLKLLGTKQYQLIIAHSLTAYYISGYMSSGSLCMRTNLFWTVLLLNFDDLHFFFWDR
ncbi:hypothetical protein ACJX0J_022695 [Zea mays]